ncbi:MAG: hypothetical protein WAU15_13665 [Nitrosomonas sp.]
MKPKFFYMVPPLAFSAFLLSDLSAFIGNWRFDQQASDVVLILYLAFLVQVFLGAFYSTKEKPKKALRKLETPQD